MASATKEIVKLFEGYIDFVQSASEDNEIVIQTTDNVIQRLYKLKLKYAQEQKPD